MLTAKEVDHFAEYLKTSGSELHNKNVEELLDIHKNMELYPVCCPSYNYSSGRCKTIARAVEEGFPLLVYRYDAQKDLYKDIPNCIDVPWEIRTSNPYPMVVKRNFIFEDCIKKGHKFHFQIDDDASRFCLPLFRERSYGHVNDAFKLTTNEFYHYWQMLIDRDGTDFSSAQSWNRFRWTKPGAENMSTNRYLPYGCFGIRSNIGLRFRKSGWEDYDFWAQTMSSGKKFLSYWLCCDFANKVGGANSVCYKGERDHSFALRTVELLSYWGTEIFKLNTSLQELTVTCNTKNVGKRPFNELVKPFELTDEIKNAVIDACENISDNKERRMRFMEILNA